MQIIRDKLEQITYSDQRHKNYDTDVQSTTSKVVQCYNTKAKTDKTAISKNTANGECEFVDIVCPNCTGSFSIPKGASKWFCPYCDHDIDIT